MSERLRALFHCTLWIAALCVTVNSQSIAAQNRTTMRLELVGTVAGNDAPPSQIGNVVSIAVRSDGGVYVGEYQPGRVTSYGRDGKVIRVMMRDGAGPGETGWPEVTTIGDTLVAFDILTHRVTWMAPSGKILREVGVQGGEDGRIAISRDGTVFVRGAGNTLQGYNGSAVRLPRNGQQGMVTWLHPGSDDLHHDWDGPGWSIVGRSPFAPKGVVAFDPLGRLVIGGSRKSQWFVVSGRDTVQTVTLADVAIPIASQVRDSVLRAYIARFPGYRDIDKVITSDKIPSRLPPWVSFDIDKAGRWWVGRPGPNGTLARWDVVVDGKITATVAVPRPVMEVQIRGALMSFGTNYVALLHESDDGSPSVGIYRMIP
jgi:hypothetical protein